MPVVVAPVVQKEVPVTLRAFGNVRPVATVSVKPRVSGQIAEVLFQEGQDVQPGDVLARIDPAPFEVALAQAKARHAQAGAQWEIAVRQEKRYSPLAKQGAVAVDEAQQLESQAEAAAANRDAAWAAVQEAELQLSYCTIRSPIAGRTGQRSVDAGNVVKADETELVVINQLKPIEVIFAVPEQYFGEITRNMARGKLKVTMAAPGGQDQEVTGYLSFVDNAIHAATGTVNVKATMPNEDLSLWPGQYSEVVLTLTTDPDAIVVPSQAVQTGQEGTYVWVIDPNDTAGVRNVTVSRVAGDEAVIAAGLQAGEEVVIDGQLRLRPGARVVRKPPVEAPVPAGPDPADRRTVTRA